MTAHRIVVALDGSTLAETVLGPVQTLSGSLHGDILLLHITHVPEALRRAAPPGPALDEIVVQEQAKARVYLDAVAQRLAKASVAVRTAVAAGEAIPEIVRFAEREQATLIALATHGRSGLQKWRHGSVADGVLHAATTPVLLLRPGEGAAPRPFEVRRIAVPLDGSPLGERSLPLAEELARGFGVPVVLLQAIEPVGLAFTADPIANAYVDYPAILEAIQAGARTYLEELAARERAKGFTVETLAPVGTAADAITTYARRNAGTLLVLTTHGRTGWRALILGSVARRVVLMADTPVLVVPAPRNT